MGSISQNDLKHITRKIIWYSLPLWGLYLVYMYLNNVILTQEHRRETLNLVKSNVYLRFLLREVFIYTFAFSGYLFLKKHVAKSYVILFFMVLVILDVFMTSIGTIRVFLVNDSVLLGSMYGYILAFICSPIYFMLFSLFAIYLDKRDLKA